MEFTRPDNNFRCYISKFTRVGNRFFVTEPNDVDTRHDDLAREDKVMGDIMSLKQENPLEVDAGFLEFKRDKDTGQWRIQIDNSSVSLDLPVKEVAHGARSLSQTRLQELIPDCEIVLL